jgi:hypothetical protein
MKTTLNITLRLIRWTLAATGFASLLGFGALVLDERSVSGAARRVVNI